LPRSDGAFGLLDPAQLAMDQSVSLSSLMVQHVRAHEYGVVAMAQSRKHRVMFSVGAFKVGGETTLGKASQVSE
jgi:hypothetical protein